jgi:hypothetical protein
MSSTPYPLRSSQPLPCFKNQGRFLNISYSIVNLQPQLGPSPHLLGFYIIFSFRSTKVLLVEITKMVTVVVIMFLLIGSKVVRGFDDCSCAFIEALEIFYLLEKEEAE